MTFPNVAVLPNVSSASITRLRGLVSTDHDWQRDHGIRAVLRILRLHDDVLPFLVEHNNAARAPYHGHQHLVTTALFANEGARQCGLSHQDRIALAYAALFHDVGHCADGGKTADVHNIETAAWWWVEFCRHAGLPAGLRQRVSGLIWATIFPHVAPGDLAEAVIQDADLMQSLTEDGDRFVAGLGLERGRAFRAGESEGFLLSVHMNTSWGKAAKKRALPPLP